MTDIDRLLLRILRLGLLLLGVVLAAGMAAGFVAGRAWAQSGLPGDGHAEMHDRYKRWHPPGNPQTSCCNNADCRPTRAFLDPEGNWRAWNGTEWLRVPWERVLPTDFAGDGRSHLCENGSFIYCFSPGQVRG